MLRSWSSIRRPLTSTNRWGRRGAEPCSLWRALSTLSPSHLPPYRPLALYSVWLNPFSTHDPMRRDRPVPTSRPTVLTGSFLGDPRGRLSWNVQGQGGNGKSCHSLGWQEAVRSPQEGGQGTRLLSHDGRGCHVAVQVLLCSVGSAGWRPVCPSGFSWPGERQQLASEERGAGPASHVPAAHHPSARDVPASCRA